MKLSDAKLDRHATGGLLERYAEGDGSPIYLHSKACPSFCDYACNGERGAEIARQIEARERSLNALLERSYALRPCSTCREWSVYTDARCPECTTSPKARIQAQAKTSG